MIFIPYVGLSCILYLYEFYSLSRYMYMVMNFRNLGYIPNLNKSDLLTYRIM